MLVKINNNDKYCTLGGGWGDAESCDHKQSSQERINSKKCQVIMAALNTCMNMIGCY